VVVYDENETTINYQYIPRLLWQVYLDMPIRFNRIHSDKKVSIELTKASGLIRRFSNRRFPVKRITINIKK